MMKSRKYRTYLKNRPEEEEELEDIAAEQQHNSIEVAAEEKVDEEVVPPTTTIPSPPTWEQTKQKVIVSMIVVMVLIHPTLTRKSVQLLACDSLGENDPNKYLRRDLQIVCWQGSHLVWATMIGIPFLVLYAVGPESSAASCAHCVPWRDVTSPTQTDRQPAIFRPDV